jgi:hypothetical protein
MRRDRKSELLNEAIGSVPSYMQWSVKEVEEIFSSFINIFKSIGSSVKLLKDTLVLNFRVISASIRGDRTKIAAAYEKFGVEREKYEKDTYEHLEYFRKAYTDPTLDNVWGVGPKILAVAANPLLFLSFRNSAKIGGKGSSDDSDGKPPPTIERDEGGEEGGGGASPRLDQALKFFGYRGSAQSLREAAGQPPTIPVARPPNPASTQQKGAPQLSQDEMKRIEEMKKLAAQAIPREIENIKQVSGILQGKVAAIKAVVDSKDFDSLERSLSVLSASGVKALTAGVQSSRKKIEADLKRQSQEDPEKFKADVERLKKETPDITDTDGVQVMLKAAFGAAKSQIQKELTTTYQQLVNDANKSLGLPIDATTKSMLEKTSLGQKYLTEINNFQVQLQTGAVAVAAAKK